MLGPAVRRRQPQFERLSQDIVNADKVLRPIHSSVDSDCWVGAGMDHSAGRQVANVLPAGKFASDSLLSVSYEG